MLWPLQYNQVPRILNPVVLAMDALPHLYKDVHVKKHIDSIYGDVETARREPLPLLLLMQHAMSLGSI